MGWIEQFLPFLYAAAADAEEHIEEDPAKDDTAVRTVALLLPETQLLPLLTLLFLLLYLPTPIPPPAKYPPLPLDEELLVDISILLLFVLKLVFVEADDMLEAD